MLEDRPGASIPHRGDFALRPYRDEKLLSLLAVPDERRVGDALEQFQRTEK